MCSQETGEEPREGFHVSDNRKGCVSICVCVCVGGVHPLYQPKLVYMPNNFVICSLDLDLK